MSLPKNKAEEVLQLCLRDESIEMKTKVYEILSLSGIKTNDPMFLVLALTGQMRVLLETAPAELNQLLDRWKSDSCESMTELLSVIKKLKISQEKYRDSIASEIEEINSKGISSVKAINRSLVTEILSTNTEIELEAKNLKQELTQLHAQIKSERKNNIKVMESLIQGMSKTYEDLDRINEEIQSSISTLEKARVYRAKKWITLTAIISAALLIVFGSSISFTILAIQKSKQSSLIRTIPNLSTQHFSPPSTK
ncbi:MAG: hypothetical protein QNJ72_45620 [Pleurocapsa sp. MO_226.B13]|nr:hypothetical protein [Pleurocapsa sp. MO_226.B13]